MEDQGVSQQDLEQEEGLLATVIVPSFRRGAILRQCLQALEKSPESSRLQVIVLDIGNYDTTTQWDLDFPGATFLRMPRNFGATRAMNIGIRSAQADVLLFLDPAVEVGPDTIPLLVSRLEGMKEAAAMMPLLVDASGKPVPQVRKLPGRGELWAAWQAEEGLPLASPVTMDQPVAVEYPGRKALMIRRAFLKGMNYFDEKYGEWGGDLELAFQIRHAGRKALLIPDIRATDRSGDEGIKSWSNGQRAILAADRLNGAAHFLAKRIGYAASFWIQAQAVMVTFLRAITFQKPAYNWKLLFGLLGGQKIDGSQGLV